MNKNQRNSLIIVVVIVLVFVLAYFGYNKLSENGIDTSYTPTIKVDDDKINDLENKTKDLAVSTSTNSSQTSTSQSPASSQDDSANVNNESSSDNDVLASSQDDIVKEDSPSSDDSDDESENSSIMPDIPINLLSGEETTFWEVAQKGKPVVINLFASWCPPCQSEMPDFIDASEEYKDQVTFMFFDSFDGQRENMESLLAFADEYFNDDTICVIDPGYISFLFNTNSLPTTVLLNKEGVPVVAYQGMVAKETLTSAIDQLLAE